MSMIRCGECGGLVDTDYNVEGCYTFGGYICEDCLDEEEDGDFEEDEE